MLVMVELMPSSILFLGLKVHPGMVDTELLSVQILQFMIRDQLDQLVVLELSLS